MIRIENLSVSYKETLALKDISLVLQGPTITGIIGPNGAGKSTLLKGMLGIIPHQGQGMRLVMTISLYSSRSKFKC